MCTYYEFLNLDTAVQVDIAKQQGSLVKELLTFETTVQMYQLDNFFLEVILCPKTKKILAKNVYHEPSVRNVHFSS